jgi:hypothetical protein
MQDEKIYDNGKGTYALRTAKGIVIVGDTKLTSAILTQIERDNHLKLMDEESAKQKLSPNN